MITYYHWMDLSITIDGARRRIACMPTKPCEFWLEIKTICGPVFKLVKN